MFLIAAGLCFSAGSDSFVHVYCNTVDFCCYVLTEI